MTVIFEYQAVLCQDCVIKQDVLVPLGQMGKQGNVLLLNPPYNEYTTGFNGQNKQEG